MNYSFHRNLNATKGRKWSFKVNSGKTTQALFIHAKNVSIKQPSGKKFEQCLAGGKRSVFAWFKTEEISIDCPVAIPAHAKRVNFNPKEGACFFSIAGEKVDFLKEVFCDEKGKCWAV